MKIASENYLEFLKSGKVCVGLVPLDRSGPLPRPGDHVYLPGEPSDEGHPQGGHLYEVEKLTYIYSESSEVDQPGGMLLSKVSASIRKI